MIDREKLKRVLLEVHELNRLAAATPDFIYMPEEDMKKILMEANGMTEAEAQEWIDSLPEESDGLKEES